jgi:ribonucleoside-diphosphate reductase alpha chain
MVHCAHATGEPGLCFIDRVNEDNPTPHIGRIEATNPCGEQPLLDYEACNLGSINLGKFASSAGFDEVAFRQVAKVGVRFLDDVVEANNYVLPEIARICRGNRKIGLGVMGFADALLKMGISYDSDQAIAFADRVARALTEEAFTASEALAEERGNFPNYLGSLWEARGRKMRNAAVTSVAPTGTISILADCSGGIEPLFALAFWRNVLGGQHLLEVNPIFQQALAQRGIAGEKIIQELASGKSLADLPGVRPELRRVFVTAHEVPPSRHVEMQATFQRYVDGAISKTINLLAAASPSEVEKVFLQAYHSRCKGITVYRHGSRPGQPMGYEAAQEPALSCPRCQAPLDDQVACSRCPQCGYTICS